MAEQTFLDEAVTQVGAEERQPGMMTPAEIIALEQGQAPQPSQQPPPAPQPLAPVAQPQPPAQQPPAPVKDDESIIDYDALLAKIEKGENLTDDEKAQVLIVQKDITDNPPEPEETFNIGGKIIPAEEIDKRIREEIIGELDVSAERMKNLRKIYVKSQNREVQQVRVQEQSEVNAAERQNLIAARMMLQNDADRKKADRERLRREIETTRARSMVSLKEEELYDEGGRINMVKFTQFNQAQEATQLLPRLEADAQALDDQLASAARELTKSDIRNLTLIAPELKTPEDPFVLFERYTKGETLDPEVKLKVLELNDLLASARSKGVTLEDEYTYRKAQGTLAVKPVAQTTRPGAPRLPELPNNAKTLADMLRAHKKRVAAAPPSGTPGGGNRPVPDDRSDAARLVAHDKQILGNEEDPFRKSLGYV